MGPDGKWVITAGERAPQLEDDLRGQVRIWDAETGKPLGAMIEHPQEVLAVAVSPDGRRLVTGCHDHKARLWEIVPRQEQK